MPWHLDDNHPECSGVAVIKDSDGSLAGCHETKAEATKQLAALYANEGERMVATEDDLTEPLPADTPEIVVRALPMRKDAVKPASDGSLATIREYMAVWDQWAEIDSEREGHFFEMAQRGSFANALEADRERYRMLFEHGLHARQGRMPLGPVLATGEDDVGAWYEGRLLDTEFNRELLPGLRSGLYGSSFLGRIHHRTNQRPEASEHNPDALPEKMVERVRPLIDFGPTPFPAYLGTVTGGRSLTDEFLFQHFATGDGLAKFAAWAKEQAEPKVPMPVKPHQDPPARTTERKADPPMGDIDKFDSVELLQARDEELKQRVQYLHAEYAGRSFPDLIQTEWDDIKDERGQIAARVAELTERENYISDLARTPAAGRTTQIDEVVKPFQTYNRSRTPENIYDLASYRMLGSTPEQSVQILRDGAKRSIEESLVPLVGLTQEQAKERATRTLNGLDQEGSVASYMLAVGSPSYRRAFAKYADAAPMAPMFSAEESRAVEQAKSYAGRAFTLASTGLPVPYQLDPTIIPVSNSSVNPFRAISRVVQTTVNEWRGATSAGITAHYDTEALEATDDTPTLAQPAISAQRATAFVPLSYEVTQDWSEVEAEMGREVADAKDDLEASKFALGTGTNEPQGVVVGATTTTATTTTGAFVAADIAKVENALGPRFRSRASFIGARAILNLVRAFDAAGGSTNWLPVPGLAQSLPTGNGAVMPYGIYGYPTYEASALNAVVTTGSEILVFGDFRYYVIVDRIGMGASVHDLVGTNHRPTGQKGLYYFWRNGAEVVSANAFRTLQT